MDAYIESLARLMSTENITLEYGTGGKGDGAWFDLKSRVLHVPLYKGLQRAETELIIGHEISHALFTPEKEWKEAVEMQTAKHGKAAGQFFKYCLNVVEDARIERKIKIRYPGMKSIFYLGYRQLLNRGVFGDDEQGLTAKLHSGQLTLVDGINLHFKLGSMLQIPEEKQLQAFVSKIERADSFDDVIAIAKELFAASASKQPPAGQSPDSNDEGEGDNSGDSSKKPSKKKSNSSSSSGTPNGQPSKKGEEGKEGDDEKTGKGTEQSDEEDSSSEGEGSGSGDEEDEAGDSDSSNSSEGNAGSGWLQPQDNLEEFFKDSLIDSTLERMNSFLGKQETSDKCMRFELPKAKLDKIIIPFRKVLDSISNGNSYSSRSVDRTNLPDFDKYVKDRKEVVSSYVRVFNQKKAASMLSRTMVHKSGSLDMDRLSMYKTSDDVFRTNVTVMEGKNHGYILILDMSGSMSGNMPKTVSQLMDMVLFCRDANIPVQVYGFTDSNEAACHAAGQSSWGSYGSTRTIQFEGGEGFHSQLGTFALIELFSPAMKRTELNQMGQLLLSYYGPNASERWYSIYLHLGGTPLGPAILTLPALMDKFQKTYKTEIMHCMFLTDGDDTCFRSLGGTYNSFFDRKTGKRLGPINARSNNGYASVTEHLVHFISMCYPESEIVNFFITPMHGTLFVEFKNDPRNPDNYSSTRGFDRMFKIDPSIFVSQKLSDFILSNGANADTSKFAQVKKQQQMLINSIIDVVAQ